MDYVSFCKRVFITAETGRALASSAKCVISDEMGDNKLLKLSCINDNEEMIQGSSERPQLFVLGGARLIIIPVFFGVRGGGWKVGRRGAKVD